MAPISLIITLAGPDRPGLVETLSTAVSEADSNWEGSRMARLSGQFAGVVNVVAPADKVEVLKNKLATLSEEGLLVAVAEANAESTQPFTGTNVVLEVVGQDRTGIVKQISQTLAELNVNVDELITECLSAPMSGERIFDTTALITLPDGVSEDDVQQGIESIAQDLAVTISELED